MQPEERVFLEKFAASYDLPRAAAAAGIGRATAYRLLRTEEARRTLDRLVVRRTAGDTLARIRREYEEIAFGGGEEVKTADRIRALEQLARLADAGEETQREPPLTVRVVYV